MYKRPGVYIKEISFAKTSIETASTSIAAFVGHVKRGHRVTLNKGKPVLVRTVSEYAQQFGTPGGDVQIQAMIQVYLNTFHFGMDIQKAVEAPRFATYSFPSSFAPNAYFPGLLMAEQSIPEDVVTNLTDRGHKVERWQDGTWKAGGVLAVVGDPKSGALTAGADPRRAGTAAGV